MNSTEHAGQRISVYEAVTAEIIKAVEAGLGSGTMPWHSGIVQLAEPTNAATKMPYHGINVVALWAQAVTKKFLSGYWASYQQWLKLGAQVRLGERGSQIIFYKSLDKNSDSPDSQPHQQRAVLRRSHVFNAEQVDGWEFPQNPRPPQVAVDEKIDAFVRGTHALIRHGSPTPCYNFREDYIGMPHPARFVGTMTSSPTESYYAVLLHELTHWTGAPHRMCRQFGKRFGDRDYAFEELIAELGAAFLCSAFRIVNRPREDHAAYISSWLSILSQDTKAIFTAASEAQRAVEYLYSLTCQDPNSETSA